MSMLLHEELSTGRGETMPSANQGGNLSRDERACILKLLQVLEDLKAQRSSITVATVISLMHVALHEGASVNELGTLSGVAQSVISRHLLDLGPHTRSKEPGAGLVEHRMSPTNMREHVIFLTAKGVRLLKKIASICGGAR